MTWDDIVVLSVLLAVLVAVLAFDLHVRRKQ